MKTYQKTDSDAFKLTGLRLGIEQARSWKEAGEITSIELADLLKTYLRRICAIKNRIGK